MSDEIAYCVRTAINQYLEQLDGEEPRNVYAMVMERIEHTLLDCMMGHSQQNQSKTAARLGISRATLRKKLIEHDLLG